MFYVAFNKLTSFVNYIEKDKTYWVYDTDDSSFELLKGSELIASYRKLGDDSLFPNLQNSGMGIYIIDSFQWKVYVRNHLLNKVFHIYIFSILISNNAVFIGIGNKFIYIKTSEKGLDINNDIFINRDNLSTQYPELFNSVVRINIEGISYFAGGVTFAIYCLDGEIKLTLCYDFKKNIFSYYTDYGLYDLKLKDGFTKRILLGI